MQILLTPKNWIIHECDREKVSQVSRNFNISPLIASVILNRGITSDDEIGHYISKDDSLFFDPFLLTDMQKAVEQIVREIAIPKINEVIEYIAGCR